MSEYTQGFCQDGAAILRDGQPMTIEEVLEGLWYADALAAHVELLCKRWSEFLGAGDERDGAAFRMQEAAEASPITSLARREAHWKAEGALDIRHLTQGDDWEDQELRKVIDDYVASRRQAQEES